jgi:uncharacterized integral membrane protein
MNEADKKLQEKIEAGFSDPVSDIDAKLYQQIFSALEKEPEYTLPTSFVDRVVHKIQHEQARSAKREYFWLCVGIILLIVAMVFAIAFTGFKISAGFLSGISAYKGLFVFGAAFIVFLNWLDKKFIRAKSDVL